MEPRLKIKKQDLYNFFFIIFYKIALDAAYYFVISLVWGYARFDLNFNALKFIESFFLLFVIFLLMPKSKEKLSNIMVWILVLVSYIPMLTLFAFMDQPRAYMYGVTGFWMLVFLLLKFPRISISPLKHFQSKTIRNIIFICLTLIVAFLVLKNFGFSFSFNLAKVYDIRSQYVEMKIPLAGYLFGWVARIVNPLLFIIFFKEKMVICGGIVLSQLLLFSVTGHKSYFFYIPFVLILVWIIKHKNPLILMSVGLIGIILLGMLSFYLVDDFWISSLFTRRTLLVPA
jgi:hypothetical protein